VNTPQALESVVFEDFRSSASLDAAAAHADAPHASSTLEESEASYRDLFESNPHPMWIYDGESLAFLLVNDAATEHYGYSQEEFLAMTLKDIRPPEDVPLLLEVTSLASKKGKYGLWKHSTKDGRIIEVEVTVRDLRFRGKTARLALIHDVTERLQAERALQQSVQEQRQLAYHLERERERLAEAQAIAKVGSWELNLTTHVPIWSEETYRIFGVNRNEVEASYEAFLERVHPDDREAVQQAYRESVASHTPYTMHHRMQMADGSIKIVQERGQTIYDAGGRPIRCIGTVQDITEQTQSEQALHHIMEGAHCLLWQAEVTEKGMDGLHWKMQFASEPANQRFLPLQIKEGKDYNDAWHYARPAEDRVRINRHSEQEIRAGRSYQQEFRSRSKDGVMHWLWENVRVEVIGEGRWRCTGVCTDITERKLAEEATRAMTRGVQCFLWYAFVEKKSDGLYWTTVMADEEAAQQFFPVDRPPGMSYPDAWTRSRLPEDSAIIDNRATEALLGGQAGYTQQFRCLRADGEWRWLNEIVRIEALEPGRWRCVGVCTDITEQKRAEEERDRFFTLSLDLLCIIDLKGYFTLLNPAFETVLGYTRAELMARPFLDFVHPEDRETTLSEMANLNAGRLTFDFETRFLCRDNSYRWLTWTATAYEGYLYAAAHDITPIREAKAELSKANEALEERVVERTAQLTETNTQLITAKQEADRANQAKSEFLSRMSHELRTPLNAILGFGQILEKQPLTPLQEESVQYILKGGRHLLDLINEVLDIARVEAGHIGLSIEPILLAEILAEACNLVRPVATERSIVLSIDPAICADSHIMADRQRLKQVLINLLSNAIKYNRERGSVSIHCLPAPGDRLRIAVQDMGPGIPAEQQQKLFVPFERLDAAHSGVEGTGLGLVLSKRLVTAMGGELTFESLPGEGSTFFIELPMALSPQETLAEQLYGMGTLQPDSSEQQSATILTIEDNLSNLRLMEVLLRSRPGITLLAAMQGSIGLDMARQHEPDLILLDLNLPDISGKEVLSRLQASALTCDIPVIVLSADATSAQIERLLGAGASAYLTKPLDVNEFLHTLDTMLPNKQADVPVEKETMI